MLLLVFIIVKLQPYMIGIWNTCTHTKLKVTKFSESSLPGGKSVSISA